MDGEHEEQNECSWVSWLLRLVRTLIFFQQTTSDVEVDLCAYYVHYKSTNSILRR